MQEFQKTSENFRLSAKQEKAILELVNPSAGTLEEVARRIKVTERTLYNWLNLPQFQEKLKEEKDKLRKEAFDSLKSTLNKAVECLGELLDSGSESIKLRSAQTILDYNIKVAETQELEERLRSLEEALEQQRNRGRL